MKKKLSLISLVAIMIIVVLYICIGCGANKSGSEGDNITWKYDSKSGTLTISGSGEMPDFELYDGALSEEQNRKRVPSWQSDIKRYDENVKKIVISEGITSIGNFAFPFFQKLKSVEIPKSVKRIGDLAFSGAAIEELNLPEGLETIGWSAFSGCKSLKNIELPESINTLGDTCFEGCNSMASATIPASLDPYKLKDYFYNCNALKKLKIIGEEKEFCLIDDVVYSKDKKELIFYPSGCENSVYKILDGVTVIADGAIDNNEFLQNIEFPDSIIKIGSTFNYCNKLVNVRFPKSLSEISEGAFYGCSSIERINIPESIEKIGEKAFCNCKNLEAIEVDENNNCYKSENGILFSQDGSELLCCPCNIDIIDYKIPEGTKIVRSYAFEKNNNIHSIYFPTAVEKLDIDCFEESNIENVLFSEGLKTIGVGAFQLCKGIIEIYVPNSCELIDEYAFFGCNKLTKVSIPKNCDIRETSFEDKINSFETRQ